jgi:cell division ATPase FtsA
MLRSGIVVTGGCAKTANLGSFIFDLSGYKVRTGYPQKVFSYQGCEGITETSASTSIGLILTAASDQTVNCTVGEAPGRVIPEFEETQESIPEGQLFPESQIETVVQVKEPKKKRDCGIKITFKKLGTKINEAWGGLYESLNEDISNEKA